MRRTCEAEFFKTMEEAKRRVSELKLVGVKDEDIVIQKMGKEDFVSLAGPIEENFTVWRVAYNLTSKQFKKLWRADSAALKLF